MLTASYNAPLPTTRPEPLGATPFDFIEKHPGWTALGFITVGIGALWFVGRVTGERHLPPLRERYKPVPREIMWNPKVKRWQDPSGRFVKAPR